MRVFVTGATGFVGAAVVKELIAAGHQVLGLARSDASAASLVGAGAEAHLGTLEDLDSLRRGAAAADGVIHTAFIHDFSQFAANCEIDRLAIEALGDALAGTDRPLIATGGTAMLAPGAVATEDTEPPAAGVVPRVSEHTALAQAPRGVRAMAIRLPPSVHGDGDHGFVPTLIEIARDKGVSAYVAQGLNRWSAAHRIDTARLYRLALEKGRPGARYHAIAEEAVPFREIADVIGRRLNLPVVSKAPEDLADHFGFLGMFAGMDAPASSQKTQDFFGWRPTQPGLIADLEQGRYFEA
jgi:nucleoside-diphosphate-sugar epimerase